MARWLLLLLVLVACTPVPADEIPHAAHRYRSDLVREARLVWGLDAPLADFAAQVHQESAWRSDAVSPVGAQGLAQFMPGTSAWIAEVYPAALGDAAPFTPRWALRALVRYDHWLWDRIKAVDDCNRLAFSLAAYNGGLGWVYRDRQAAADDGADHRQYWGVVETYDAGRAASAWRENRGYPQRILRTLAPRYVLAGWGLSLCADEVVL